MTYLMDIKKLVQDPAAVKKLDEGDDDFILNVATNAKKATGDKQSRASS